MFKIRKILGCEEGSSLVELAAVISFLFIPILVGIVGFAGLVYYSIEVADAAHEGATYASQYFRSHTTNPFPNNVAAVAQAAESNIPASMIVTPTVACGCAAPGSTARVTGTCSGVTASTCTGATPLLFVTVNTQTNINPWVSMKILGMPASFPIYGSATFELAP